MIYGAEEHLIWSLKLILTFNTPISEVMRGDCWAVEAGPLGVVGVNGAMLSIQMQYSSLQSTCT